MNSSAFMDNLKQLFAECDVDNNGSLGREEFSTLCAKIGLNKEAANETFDRLDSDNNDRITFEEFGAGFNQYSKQSSPSNSPQPPAQSPTSDASRLSSPSPPPTPAPTSANPQHSNNGVLGRQTSSNPSTPKSVRSPTMARSQKLSPGPVSSRARKNISPLGVISLGSTGSSGGYTGGMRTSSSTTGITTQETSTSNSDYLTSADHGDGKADSMVVFSSDAFGDCDQASGSGQYGSLISSCGSLSQMRNMQDLLECVQKLQSENQILTQIFFKDKREREEYINQLGEEFDLQVREVEERANRRAKEELEGEKKRLREMMAAERETLQHHYQTIEKMSKLVRSPNGRLEDGESIDRVKSKLEDTYLENRRLKKSLLDTKTDVAMIWKEMEKLKRQYEDKLSSAYEKNIETRSECDLIKQQLNLVKDSNQKLQDASDVITNYIADKVEPVIKVATGEEDSPAAGNSLNGSAYNRLGGTASQSNSRKGSILSEYLNGDQSHSLDGYNGSVNSADLESIASSSRGRGASLKGAAGDEADNESLSAASSSAGNFHLRVPKSSSSRGQQQPPSNHNTIQEPLTRDGVMRESGLAKKLAEMGSSSSSLTSIGNSSQSISRNAKTKSEDAPRQPEPAPRSQQQQVEATKPVAELKSASGIRNLGRHFFSGSRTQSDAKLDQQPKTDGKTAELQRQSMSVDTHDEPIVEPADGPSTATFNIILVGDSFVGKSSFAARFMEGNFVQGLISNCSIDFKTKAYKVDGINYTVNLWDTAGQERFRSITASYFRKADGIILMYDVTDKRSYLNVRNWMSTISDTAAENVAVLLVGNKIDLRRKDNQEKCVPAEEGVRLAKEYDIVFLETSVKTGMNLVPSMGKLIRLIAKNNQPAEEDTDRIKLSDKGKTFNCMPKNC